MDMTYLEVIGQGQIYLKSVTGHNANPLYFVMKGTYAFERII